MGIFLIYSFSGCFIGFVLFCVSLSGHVTGLYFQVQNMGHESDLVTRETPVSKSDHLAGLGKFRSHHPRQGREIRW